MITWVDKNSAGATQAEREVTDAEMNQIKSNVNALYDATRVGSNSNPAAVTPNVDTTNYVKILALAQNVTINAPSGTPYDGQPLSFKFLDTGTSRTITWNAAFTGESITLPTATVINKVTRVHFMYDAEKAKYVAIGLNQEV